MNLLLISLALVFLYILFIPSILYTIFTPLMQDTNNSQISYSGAIVNINHGENLAVSVKRPRWYGTIYGDGNNENLYLFNSLPLLPLKVEGKNTTYIHILFFLGLIFINVYSSRKKSIKHEVLYE